ncbi:TIGR03943 family putative permease subunit [Nocardia pseudobrasiliensis]|uniref:Putative repeat protein (TIGR03943 family) n=1 Tax=Nocardia pseudobrasiliensis TaxID=45979 RepID=A0A370HS19_9NOCA|nr:TIGR03943 family protein [Nocardia pseudobrasiliensis]RDI61333.1 putative repeat protein (TIGR03943 family) [Nocardia pseudobrasiliensis]
MNRESQNVLLVLIGGAVLRTALDGHYLRYVKPGMLPFLLISGVGFVLLGAIAIVRDIRRGHPADAHEHGTGRAQWSLLAPIAALLLVAPPALGAAALPTSPAAQVAPAASTADDPDPQRPFPPLPDDPAPTLSIYDLVNRALLDSTHSLDGREVTISGFLVGMGADGQPRQAGSTIELARVLITCCVADAQYIYVHLSGITEPLADDTWLEVRGTVDPGSAQRDHGKIPTLLVSDYHQIPKPDHTYERAH